MHELVHGYTDAVVEGLGPDVGPVAGELEAFVQVLAGSSELRAVMENSTLPAPVRRSVVQELLAKKASPITVQLLSFAVQSGPAADYVLDVAGVAAAAAAKRDGKVPLEQGPLGRVAATERADGYATALLAPLKERQLGNVEDELFRFMRVVEGNDELRAALTTSALPARARSSIVLELLGRRASRETARLAWYAAATARPRDYLVLLDALVQRVAKEADRRVADVRSATEMSEAERLRLAAALTRFAGYPVDVRVTRQPDLLGGFVATLGDMVVDASLRRRLEQAREALFAPAPVESTKDLPPSAQP